MTPGIPRAPRRSDALSKERILESAIAVLDAEATGTAAGGLTLRALMTRLSTGSGAIYHHVGTMDDLRAAAAEAVLQRSVEEAADDATPSDALRAVAVAIFDALDAHRWLGAQLIRDPSQPAVRRIWKTLGAQLHRLGVTGPALSDAGSTLAGYILGSAAQQTAGPRQPPRDADRTAYLERLADQVTTSDPDPLVGEIATRLREHDDREQFRAGVDIILRGITS